MASQLTLVCASGLWQHLLVLHLYALVDLCLDALGHATPQTMCCTLMQCKHHPTVATPHRLFRMALFCWAVPDWWATSDFSSKSLGCHKK